jgi:hypothetical protein
VTRHESSEGGMECWPFILTLTSGTHRTAELASHAGRTLPPRKFLSVKESEWIPGLINAKKRNWSLENWSLGNWSLENFQVLYLESKREPLVMRHTASTNCATRPLWAPYSSKSHRIYIGTDKSLAPLISRCILFDGENISFDASLVTYINSTNISPIMIINRI